jgi:hypothetical protein
MTDNIHPFRAPMKALTPALCAKLQSDMLAACQRIAKAQGLVVVDGGPLEMDPWSGFEFGVKVGIPAPDGTVFDPEQVKFALLARKYGLSPDDYGREFSTGRETFRIVGIETRRPKYPINVERIPDRQGFKFTAENVALCLKAME